jgi:hypothetical protein
MEQNEHRRRRPTEPAMGYSYKNFTEEPKVDEKIKKNEEPAKKKQRLKHIIGVTGKVNNGLKLNCD